MYAILNFTDIIGKHKARGIDINNLLKALVNYKLTDNFSIKHSHEWINRPKVLAEFTLPSFSERTLCRVLETIGAKRDGTISAIQEMLFEMYEFLSVPTSTWTGPALCFMSLKADMENMDTVEIIVRIKHITVGVAKLAESTNIQIGMTIEPGNPND